MEAFYSAEGYPSLNRQARTLTIKCTQLVLTPDLLWLKIANQQMSLDIQIPILDWLPLTTVHRGENELWHMIIDKHKH